MINGSYFAGQWEYSVLETGISVAMMNVIIRSTLRIVHRDVRSFRLASKTMDYGEKVIWST